MEDQTAKSSPFVFGLFRFGRRRCGGATGARLRSDDRVLLVHVFSTHRSCNQFDNNLHKVLVQTYGDVSSKRGGNTRYDVQTELVVRIALAVLGAANPE